MNSTDKCPHCGADSTVRFCETGLTIYECDSTSEVQSRLCRERVAHTETRKECEKLREEIVRISDELGCKPEEIRDRVARIGDTNLHWQAQYDLWRSIAEEVGGLLQDAMYAFSYSQQQLFKSALSRLEAARKGTAQDSQVEEDWRELVLRACKHVSRIDHRGLRVRFGMVTTLFCVGSTRAKKLCKLAGVDPFEELKPSDWEEEDRKEGGV